MKNQKVNVEELNMELDSLLEESTKSVEPVEDDMSDPYYAAEEEDDDYSYEDDDYSYDAVEREIYCSPQEEEERLEAYYKYLEENNTPPYNEGDIVQVRSLLAEQREDELAVVLKVKMPPVYEDDCPECFMYCKGHILQGYIESNKTVIGVEIIFNYFIPELDRKLDEYQKNISNQ